jgi:hypothetical protein
LLERALGFALQTFVAACQRFEELLHPSPDIMAATISLDYGLLFAPALDFTIDGADALVVFNLVAKFGLRVAQALGGFGFFDPLKQFGSRMG